MSVSLQSAPASKQSLGDRRSRRHRHPVHPISPHLAKRGHHSAVRSLPSTRYRPLWVRSLITAQRFSSTLAMGLAISVLMVYGQVAYFQQLGDQEYQRMATLRRLERQFRTANEALKEQVAQQATNPSAGFVQPTMANTIFLPVGPKAAISAPTPDREESKSTVKVPLGY